MEDIAQKQGLGTCAETIHKYIRGRIHDGTDLIEQSIKLDCEAVYSKAAASQAGDMVLICPEGITKTESIA